MCLYKVKLLITSIKKFLIYPLLNISLILSEVHAKNYRVFCPKYKTCLNRFIFLSLLYKTNSYVKCHIFLLIVVHRKSAYLASVFYPQTSRHPKPYYMQEQYFPSPPPKKIILLHHRHESFWRHHRHRTFSRVATGRVGVLFIQKRISVGDYGGDVVDHDEQPCRRKGGQEREGRVNSVSGRTRSVGLRRLWLPVRRPLLLPHRKRGSGSLCVRSLPIRLSASSALPLSARRELRSSDPPGVR